MYYLLNEKEKDLIKKIEKETNTTYLYGDMIKVESIISALENLNYELEVQKERYEELQRDIEDNYKLKNESEIYF